MLVVWHEKSQGRGCFQETPYAAATYETDKCCPGFPDIIVPLHVPDFRRMVGTIGVERTVVTTGQQCSLSQGEGELVPS